MVITLLSDSSWTIGVDEQNLWANEFDLGHPVLADNDYELSRRLWPNDDSRPQSVLLGPGAEVLFHDVSEGRLAEEF